MSGIFISYRRSASKHLARLIFTELRTRGHDVFLDVDTIDAGAFDRIILNQIAARPHFVLVLSRGALERCTNESDWLRREIEEAFRLQRNIVPIFDEGFDIEQEKNHLPEPTRSELARLNAPPYSHYYFEAFIDTIHSRFLKTIVDESLVRPTPIAERGEVERRIREAIGAVDAPRSKVYDILPAPFEWVDIPAGEVTLAAGGYVPEDGQTFRVPAFAIARYPVTNAQFTLFIEAGCYDEKKWWTSESWKIKQQEDWSEPRNWNSTNWSAKPDYPVVGVSWYEGVAFCRWLSDVSGESINLATEQQWQRAAQGDDNRAYPWGNEWSEQTFRNCNHSIGMDWKDNRISSVRTYEGKGDSPFGVVDMSGNVWEWTLTMHESGKNDLKGAEMRILRGGSWKSYYAGYLRADFRLRIGPVGSDDDRGFRIIRIY